MMTKPSKWYKYCISQAEDWIHRSSHWGLVLERKLLLLDDLYFGAHIEVSTRVAVDLSLAFISTFCYHPHAAYAKILDLRWF
jgi:hypothetical protein